MGLYSDCSNFAEFFWDLVSFFRFFYISECMLNTFPDSSRPFSQIMSGNWDDHSTSTAIVKSEVTTDFHYPLDLTCNVPPPPTRGQTVPYTIQPLEASKQLLPTINGCSLTSSPTSSSSSIEHEDEAMGYNPSGSVSQLSIFRRQTNNSLQVIFHYILFFWIWCKEIHE